MNSFKKLMLNIAGCIFLVFAVLGILLPLVPASPFLLLASACFVRGSDRLHAWLMGHKVFGTYIRNLRQGRGMPLKAKLMTVGLLWLSLLYSMYRLEAWPLRMVLVLVGVGVTTLIFRMKTFKPEE